MQLYVGDYLADTLHLTTEQHGAYLLLLMTMWRAGASLPNDASKLARICRVSPKRWPSVWAEISAFFEIDGDLITNPRLTKEHQKAVSISQERKTAGKKGGQANALKNQKAGKANASDLPEHSQKPEPEVIKNGGGGDARARDDHPDASQQDLTFREQILVACGVSTSGLTGRGGQMIGRADEMAEINARMADRGISETEVLRIVSEAMVSKNAGRDPGPPSSLRFFLSALDRFAAARDAPIPDLPAHVPRAAAPPGPPRIRARLPSEIPPETIQ